MEKIKVDKQNKRVEKLQKATERKTINILNASIIKKEDDTLQALAQINISIAKIQNKINNLELSPHKEEKNNIHSQLQKQLEDCYIKQTTLTQSHKDIKL